MPRHRQPLRQGPPRPPAAATAGAPTLHARLAAPRVYALAPAAAPLAPSTVSSLAELLAVARRAGRALVHFAHLQRPASRSPWCACRACGTRAPPRSPLTRNCAVVAGTAVPTRGRRRATRRTRGEHRGAEQLAAVVGQEAQLVVRTAAKPAVRRRAALLVFMRPANSLAGPFGRRRSASKTCSTALGLGTAPRARQ